MSARNTEAVGLAVARSLQFAFDYYNRELFGGRLPPCAVIVHRHRGALGYFMPEVWEGEARYRAHEIAINPDHVRERGTVDVLSTLAHEMAHLEQQVHGTPSRKGYHNKEWGKMMDAIGLTPSSTGQPGGKRTGQRMSHVIEGGAPFAVVTERLLTAEPGAVAALKWGTLPPIATEKKKAGQRVKYECPNCAAAVWGKTGLGVRCRPCNSDMAADETEEWDDA